MPATRGPVSDIVLLGSPVGHSRSPVFQNAALAVVGSPWRYGVRDVDAAGVRRAVDEMRAGLLVGANVTAPHKRLACDVADESVGAARVLGVANTLMIRDSLVIADNTDVAGVRAMYDLLVESDLSTCVVIGAGGAARAAVLAIGNRVDRILVANRTRQRAERLVADLASHVGAQLEVGCLQTVADADVIVQATSLRDVEPSVWAPWFDAAPRLGAALDLVYSASDTGFVRAARARGIAADDGAVMLLEQGAVSFTCWTGVPAPRGVMYDALEADLGRPIGGPGRPGH